MARYTGPRARIARRFKEPILGPAKALKKKNYPPGQHGQARKKRTEYGEQLLEKQKAKYTYGLLERQFRNTFKKAAAQKGVTGHILLQLLERRLDNTVFRLGLAPTRAAARQLVSHKHIQVNGRVVNIPSYSLQPGDVIALRSKSSVTPPPHDGQLPYGWLSWDVKAHKGTFVAVPERADITENINEQSIVELYSK